MKEQILSWCKTLSKSQGYYSLLLNDLQEDDTMLEELAKNNFKDIVDFIMYIES